MTIIAGFKCDDGIVLCADTQETVGHLSKRNVPKLRFEPRDPPFGSDATDVAVAFCGAANNGPFIDKLVDRSWESVQTATSLDEACGCIEETIKSFYKEYGRIYQRGYCPEAEIIYGVKMHDGSRMFYALGPVVNERNEYASGGAGYYMADFLASRMYGNLLTLRQCIILAAYVLFQAKDHVDGCGGESHIAVLRNEGTSGQLRTDRVNAITDLVQDADEQIGKILMSYADLDLDEQQVTKRATELVKERLKIREHQRTKFLENEKLWDEMFGVALYDALGLPMPPQFPPKEDEQSGE